MKFSKRLKVIFYVILAVVFISDFFVERAHPVFAWDTIPGFWALYGFIGCVAIVLISKFIGHKCGIMKKEDFYD